MLIKSRETDKALMQHQHKLETCHFLKSKYMSRLTLKTELPLMQAITLTKATIVKLKIEKHLMSYT
jgi:hypothetical protein